MVNHQGQFLSCDCLDVPWISCLDSEPRQGTGLFPNTREYSRYFGLGGRVAKLLGDDTIVMDAVGGERASLLGYSEGGAPATPPAGTTHTSERS